uniref:Uncharacterized protein n=1 Tax=Kalanchoe fedtschenkoi TaxID=63787 RepID=A0A7N1A9Z8_KALFE
MRHPSTATSVGLSGRHPSTAASSTQRSSCPRSSPFKDCRLNLWRSICFPSSTPNPEFFLCAFQPPSKFDKDGSLVDEKVKETLKALQLPALVQLPRLLGAT